MSRILNAVSVLNSEPKADAIDQLFTVAKKFKPLPVPEEMRPSDDVVRLDGEDFGTIPIPLDRCGVDERYQRPLDREKVEAMRRDRTYEREPIQVNFDPSENVSYWIIDGQHRAEAARLDGKQEIMAYMSMIPSQEEQERETGIMAKTLCAGDAYEGRVLPSQEPALIDVLEGMGAAHEVSKVETYGWRGKCYTVRCSTGTVTYVPHDAVEKDHDGILAQPERGLLRFDGLTEAEVQFVLKTIALDVAPVNPPSRAPHDGAQPLAEVLGIEGDVEILAEGIGGRTWPADWVWMDDGGVAVFNDNATLAYYPVISRHPTGEGDWRLIGPKHDLTIRPAHPSQGETSATD